MHARSGGTIEVMGLLVGKVEDDTMIVMDTFALPVEVRGEILLSPPSIFIFVPGKRNSRERTGRGLRVHGRVPSTYETSTLLLQGSPRSSNPFLGGSPRERDGLVPQPSWLRLLVVWHRCVHPNAEPEVLRALAGYCRTFSHSVGSLTSKIPYFFLFFLLAG